MVLATGLLLGADVLAASNAVTAENPALTDRLIPFDVSINGSAAGNWLLLEHTGALYARPDAFEEWRVLRNREVVGFAYRSQTWYPLSSIPGFEERRNDSTQSIALIFSAAAFAATRLSGVQADRATLTPSIPAVFLNYDVTATHSASTGADASSDVGFLTELGFTSQLGVLSMSSVGRFAPGAVPNSQLLRLETTYTRDYPELNMTLRIGDSSTRSSQTGRSVYFGGVQLSNNFALTPGFVTQPIPTISGTSRTASTLALYINDTLRQTSNVPAGPFSIDNFPMLTTPGEARVVVRDLLGRETTVVQHFFTDASLLKTGLSDWSVEVGRQRLNLGTANADYGDAFAAGALRRGINDTTTLEGQAQFSPNVQSLGLGVNFELPFQSLGQVALACGRATGSDLGYLWVTSAEHNLYQHGFSVYLQGATANFRQLGLETVGQAQRSEMSASYSYSTEQFGTFSLSLAKIADFDKKQFTTYNASYSTRIFAGSAISFNATQVRGFSQGYSVGAVFHMPFGAQVNAASGLTSRAGAIDGYASASRGLTSEIGTGWRVMAGNANQTSNAEAGLYYQGSKGMLTGDISTSSQHNTLRLGAQGSLVYADRMLFAARRIEDSFAVVNVDGYGGVGVGFQGSTITRTDGSGKALLTRLMPYQSNSIRLDPTQLPISAELDAIEQVAVPARRSAVKVTFPVREGRGALIKIVLENGQVAPAGAELRVLGDSKEFFVARRGEAFVTGLKDANLLTVKTSTVNCEFAVNLPPGKLDDIARVGPLTCIQTKNIAVP